MLCKLFCLHNLREFYLPGYVLHCDSIKQLQIIQLTLMLYFTLSEICLNHYTSSS